jgi:transcriptional regulator with XRE-family HTH domain
MDTFKTRLRFYMKQAGLNPTSLSRKAGLNVTAVRDILAHEGTPNPRIDTFIKLCRALGVSPEQLSPDFASLHSQPDKAG